MKSSTNARCDPWSIDDSEFYELESRNAEMQFLLRYAVLAPSGHNTQPWKFGIVPEGIEVFADFTRRLPQADPADRELLMSVGAAIMNLRVAAAHFGFESTVVYGSSPCDTPAVATIKLRETCGPDKLLGRLFPAIRTRRTNRQPFDGEPIGPDSVSALCDLTDQYPEFVHVLLPHDKARIAELVAQAGPIQMANRAVREELADWVRSAGTDASDGIDAGAFGFPSVLSPAAASVIRRVNLGGINARHDAALIGATPLLVMITAADDRVSLLEAGQVVEQLLLTVTLTGLQYSFMNQPVQVDALRKLLAPVVASPHPPQLLLRIGYAPAVSQPTRRRDLADMLHAR